MFLCILNGFGSFGYFFRRVHKIKKLKNNCTNNNKESKYCNKKLFEIVFLEEYFLVIIFILSVIVSFYFFNYHIEWNFCYYSFLLSYLFFN